VTRYRSESASGALAFAVEPTCPPEFLGDLPPEELYLTELTLPWDRDWMDAGRELIPEALRELGDVPDRLQVRTNRESHPEFEQRVALFESLGMDLFQEKEGVTWVDDGQPIEVPGRLDFATISETGSDRFRDVIAAVGESTLDRNDRYYRSHMDPADWGAVYLTYMGEGEEPMWLLGTLPGGEPVGFVAVVDFDGEGTATIGFIGVVPEQRGNGYIDDLLAAGTAAAREHGFRSIHSDVDTLNTPMLAAMERAGHHTGVRPWHVWHQIGSVSALTRHS
jgi:GNAT superfamily N-acetyltransferase